MAKSTAVAVRDDQTYAIMLPESGDIIATLRENLGGDNLTPQDLDRIRVPTGGGTSFEIPSLGEPEAARTFEGIVIHQRTTRAFWPDQELSGDPPACFSDDGIKGAGMPGGHCDACFYNRFGSKGLDPDTVTPEQLRDARGPKACGEKRLLFVVRPGEMLPSVLVCPPTSIPGIKKSFLRLSSKGLAYRDVVFSFSLKAEKNKAGQPYSVIVPTVTRQLDDAERAAVKAYADSIRPALDRVRIDDDAESEEA